MRGADLLLANVPSMLNSALAFTLILRGVSAWFWVWFLALAMILGIVPKSKSDDGDPA